VAIHYGGTRCSDIPLGFFLGGPAQHSEWPPQIRSPKPIRALGCLYGCAIGRQIKQSVVAQWNGFMNAHAAAQVVWVVEIPVDYFIPRERWRCAATRALSLLIGLLGSRTRVALRTRYRWRRGRLAHNWRSGSGVSLSQSRSSSCDPASAIAPNVVPRKVTTLPWLATDDLHQQPSRSIIEARCSEFPLELFLRGPAQHSGWSPQIRSPKSIRALGCLHGCAIGRQIKQSVVRRILRSQPSTVCASNPFTCWRMTCGAHHDAPKTVHICSVALTSSAA